MVDERSVYDLVTKLCETLISAQNKRVTRGAVQKLRSKAFDKLLLNRTPIDDPYWLENCDDYHCQFLAWEFILRNTYKQEEMAASLESCVQTIMASKCDQASINGILHVLLKLKRPPRVESQVSPSSSKIYRHFAPSDFRLPDAVSNATCLDLTTHSSVYFSPNWDANSLMSRALARSRSKTATATSASASTRPASPIGEEARSRAHKGASIWEIVSSIKFTKRRTWEALGSCTPAPEKPFISEADGPVCDMIEMMRDLRERQVDFDEKLPTPLLTRAEYMRDLKSLVVGMQSLTFAARGDVFVLNQDVLFEGIAFDVFAQYAMLMMNVGACYKALDAMAARVLGGTNEHGFVYLEFHRALRRYLMFYHAAAVNVDPAKGVIAYHAHIRTLSMHLFAVAAICKAGTFSDSNCAPSALNAVDLLNFLYRRVFTQPNRRVLLVLHALLFPCMQTYFLKYLNPWLLQGTLDDPFEEFFIRKNAKYLCTRGRTYWTRSFAICGEAVPAFCGSYAAQIFECGRVANLLRLCAPTGKVFECLAAMGGAQRERLAQCCITEAQVGRLQRSLERYELHVVAQIGALFSLKRMLQFERDEELVFNKFRAARRASSVLKVQSNRLDRLSKDILQQRETTTEEEIALRQKEIKIIKADADHIIAFYKKLANTASKLNVGVAAHNDFIGGVRLGLPSSSSQTVAHAMTEAQRNRKKVEAIEYGVAGISAPRASHCDVGDSGHEQKQRREETRIDAPDEAPQLHDYIRAPKFELARLTSVTPLLRSRSGHGQITCFGKRAEADAGDAGNSPMRIAPAEVASIQCPLLDSYISRSLLLPIRVQLSLAKSELLKHFVEERELLQHLERLRHFYLLRDAGYARCLTRSLFQRLHDADAADGKEVFSQRLLCIIMQHARVACHARADGRQRVSLLYAPVPRAPVLSAVYDLDCVSLQYELRWPLNILLPTKQIGKYDEIFKFLLKTHRVAWALQRALVDLKQLAKKKFRAAQLRASPHYQRCHLWRHVMTHFVSTLLSYIVGEVFEGSWRSFRDALQEIDDLDGLYNAHGIYLRQIHFLCFLHQKTSQVRDILLNIFGIFLTFYEYLRARAWKRYGDVIVHPNYLKMECIFHNFLSLARYFLKIYKKMTRAAYQPQFNQLIDLLDINNFYSTSAATL